MHLSLINLTYQITFAKKQNKTCDFTIVPQKHILRQVIFHEHIGNKVGLCAKSSSALRFFSLCLLGKLHRHVSRKIPNSVHIPSLCFVCIRLCSNSLLGSDFNVLDCYCLSWCCSHVIIKGHFLKLAKRLIKFRLQNKKQTATQMTQELRDDNLKG